MSLYVLDTDTLTLLEDGHPAVGQRFLQERPEDTATTVLTVEEQLSGWYTQVRKAKRPERLAWAYRERHGKGALGENTSTRVVWIKDTNAIRSATGVRPPDAGT